MDVTTVAVPSRSSMPVVSPHLLAGALIAGALIAATVPTTFVAALVAVAFPTPAAETTTGLSPTTSLAELLQG